jgi:WD40 repeat protein
VAFSPDGRLIAARDRDDNRIVTAWRVADGTRVHGFRGHGQEVADAAFSSDGKQLATAGGYDNTVRIWRVADGALLQTLRGEDAVHKVALSHRGELLAAANERGMTVWWDLKTGRRLARTRAFKYAINDLGFLNGDPVLLWTAGGDRPPSNMCVRLWQVPLS